MTAPTQPSTERPPDEPPAKLDWDSEDEFVRVRWAGWRMMVALAAAAVIVFAGYTVQKEGRAWFDRQLDPVGEPTDAIDLVVPRGATTSDIGVQLAGNDVIPNSTFFRYYVEWKNAGNFQAGLYTFYVNSSVDEAIAVLDGGPKPPEIDSFIIREGLWTDEIVDQLARQLPEVTAPQLQAALNRNAISTRYRPEDQPSWEGLLFPDTYEINKDSSATEVLQKMSDEFARVTGSLGYGAAETQLGYSAYEVLIVASLIESETRVDEERPLVASVIYNRLRENEPLGIDATCIYQQHERGIELTKSMLADDGPYACREGASIGLPPTPISSPGRASLEAAIKPAESEFLFYVLTDPSGRHTFTETYEEFLEAKAICQEQELC